MICRLCRSLSFVLLSAGTIGVATAQSSSTRPPEGIDRGLRPLSPSEIPPNLSFYTLDPLYEPGRPLGWAKERIEERLDRGMLALAREGGGVYLGWRLLRDDPPDVAFDVYRGRAGAAVGVRLNASPLTTTTDFVDLEAPVDRAHEWWVVAVVAGRELGASSRARLPASLLPLGYRALRLKEDVTGVAAVAIGDLDGDGGYDFVVKHPAGGKDPGRVRVNEGTYKIDAYDGRTGAFRWRIDLGWNVDMGIWWTPLVVRDLDGDGKAEVCLRTAPYAATLDEAFPSAKTGNVLEGPEWLAVYDGATGALVDEVDWIERGKLEDWGDRSGNRASRHMLGVAYLDGKTPAVLAVRGTYGLMKVDAWTLRDRKLQKLWRWSNERAPFKFHGQGQHSIKVGDIDGDGCDEILNGTSIPTGPASRSSPSTRIPSLATASRSSATSIPRIRGWSAGRRPERASSSRPGASASRASRRRQAGVTRVGKWQGATVRSGIEGRPCLMQDLIYRHDVTHRSMGYAHTPQLGTYLGARP